jgi:cyclopropane-fatty-acyl-phospholipid synthase
VSTQADIQESYDVSNDFFRLFLDERMIYTCALFAPESDDLEAAQLNKLGWIADAARVAPGMSVLDIGCGWGGNLRFLAETRGVAAACGITLSPAQYQQAARIGLPQLHVHLTDYRTFEPERVFDAVVSIGMFEHIATPEEARDGRHIEIYRDYFRRAHEWTRPGAWFGLQSVLQHRIPRERKALGDLFWATRTIFPGAITPRLEAVMAAVTPYWEVMEVQTRREHYARTMHHWHQRLVRNKTEICRRWGDARFAEYDRYLSTMSRAFHDGWMSLGQFALRRIDRN